MPSEPSYNRVRPEGIGWCLRENTFSVLLLIATVLQGPLADAQQTGPRYFLYTGPQQVTSMNGGGCWDAPLPQPTSGSWDLQQFAATGVQINSGLSLNSRGTRKDATSS